MVPASLRGDAPQATPPAARGPPEGGAEVVGGRRAAAPAGRVAGGPRPRVRRGPSVAVGLGGGAAMTLVRREFLQLAAGAAALRTLARDASAQGYPTRPVRLILGFPAGGSTDLVARIMAAWLSERLGQSVVVENKPGAGTNLAAQTAVNSPPDGYTLLFVTTTNAINVTFYPTLPFNFLRDVEPVAGLVDLPFVVEVNPSVPAKTAAEFIAHAKPNPATSNTASFGTGTISHLAWELLKLMTGVDTVHVPYHAGAPMVTDLIGGRVEAGIA